MALFAIGSTLAKCSSAKPLLAVTSVSPILSATIVCKALRDVKDKPKPYPYKDKRYRLWTAWYDRTTHRFDENSKIIVVEGAVASGKTALAKQLAEDLDMYHIPEANMDIKYINPYGYDMRKLDPQLPESLKSFDEKNFCLDPFHINVAAFQMWMYRLRFSVYIDALAHVLSTGQGVVMERSPWSDIVFMEAMCKNNFISKEARNVYLEVRRNSLHLLMRPHLVIYLDMPVNVVQQKIKSRGRAHEQNSKALTTAFLQDIEDFYKTKYLPEITTHAELLMYDWSEGGDPEVLVEDIERVDFDKYTKHDAKLKDWCLSKERLWEMNRRLYADKKARLLRTLVVPNFSAEELVASGEDWDTYYKVWYSAPGMQFAPGYNEEFGDTGLLFKSKTTDKYKPY